MLVAPAAALGFVLVLLRTSALLLAVPGLSARAIPSQVKLGMALAFALAAWLGAGSPAAPLPDSLPALGAAAALETALGLCAGLGARWLLEAAAAAAQTAGLLLGVGLSSVLDPLSGAESQSLGELVGLLATAAAIALGIHREAVGWLALSVREIPPGTVSDLPSLVGPLITEGLYAIALAVRLGFPLLAAVTLGHLVLGLLGRVAPQLSLSTLGFSVAIAAGGFALYQAVPALVQLAARSALTALSPS